MSDDFISHDPARAEAVNCLVGVRLASAMVARLITPQCLALTIGVEPAHLRACLLGQDRLSPDALLAASIRLAFISSVIVGGIIAYHARYGISG